MVIKDAATAWKKQNTHTHKMIILTLLLPAHVKTQQEICAFSFSHILSPTAVQMRLARLRLKDGVDNSESRQLCAHLVTYVRSYLSRLLFLADKKLSSFS